MKKATSKYLFITASLLIIFDQATKLIVKGFNFFGFEHKGMYLGESIPVIEGILSWTFVENPGMAFGLELGAAKILLSSFSIFASIGLAWYLSKINNIHIMSRIGIMLLFAGAFGNMIDRVFYGYIFRESALFYGKVVDFIQVNIPDINIGSINWETWPVFNIADSCVSIGVVVLIFFHNELPSLKDLRSKNNDEELDNSNSDPELSTEADAQRSDLLG